MKFSQSKGFIDRQSYVAQYLALSVFTAGVVSALGSDDLLAAFAAGKLSSALKSEHASIYVCRLCHILGRTLQSADGERKFLLSDRFVIELRLFRIHWCLASFRCIQ